MSTSLLREDNLIVNQLKSHLNYVCEQMTKAESRMDILGKETADFHIRIQNIQNSVCELKNKRYVQELIIDENGDRPFRKQEIIPQNTKSDAELRNSIVKATTDGIEMISKMFKPIAITIPNQVLNSTLIPNDIYEAIDSHLIRDLPPIIGSSGFKVWNATEVVDRPVETNEIVIGSAPIRQQEKQSIIEQIPQLTSKIPSPIPIAPPPMPTQQKIQEAPKQDNDLLKQLSERLAKKEQKDEKSTNFEKVEQNTEPSKPIVQPKKSQKLLDSSSSEEELFEKRPVVVEKEIIVIEKIVETPNEVKKPLLNDESDDSFDELFKQSQKTLSSSKPKPVVEKVDEIKEKLPPTTKPKIVDVEEVKSSKTVPTIKKKHVKRPEPKKRSLFDSTSSEDEEVKTFTERSQQPKLEDSSNEEMPKGVLNSVPNDFSSRLNQALLKRPSPSPSSSIVKPAETPIEKPSEKSTPTPISTSPRKRESVEHKKQDSVAALRDKLGSSIMKAHTGNRLSTDTLDFKKPGLSSSSDEETRKVGAKTDDDNFIQNLKARPKPPGRNAQRRPPISHPVSEIKEEIKPVKKENPLEIEKPKITTTQKPPIESKGTLKASQKLEPQENVKKLVPKVTTSQKSTPEVKKVDEKKVDEKKVEEKEVEEKKVDEKKVEEKKVVPKVTTSQSTNKPIKSRKGLFDSDSDDPF